MKLSNLKVTTMWNELQKNLKKQAFSTTTFVNDNSSIKTQILALFAKNGQPTNQLEQMGFIICSHTIFSAKTQSVISDQGIITNDYFVGEIIDVDNVIIPNTYIHLVQVISGPIVINDITVRIHLNETLHQGIIRNSLALKLFLAIANQFLNPNWSFLDNNSYADHKKFIIMINYHLKLTKNLILKIETIANDLLKQKLTLTNLMALAKNNPEYLYLKDFSKKELGQLMSLEQLAITNLKRVKKAWQITGMAGKAEIAFTFNEKKKPIINAINILNKKIKLINQPEVIKPLPLFSNIESYQDLCKLQAIKQKLTQSFNNWKKQSQTMLETLTNLLVGSYYSEVVDELKIVHYSFNNDLLDTGLMILKGRNLLENANHMILFLSNNITDNPSMIILISDNLKPELDLETIINKLANKQFKKINYHDNIIIISANNYQIITDFISEIINYLKLSVFKHN